MQRDCIGRRWIALALVAVLLPVPVSASGGGAPSITLTLDSTIIDSAMPINATVVIEGLTPGSNYSLEFSLLEATVDPADAQVDVALASRWTNFTAGVSTETVSADWSARPATPHLQTLRVSLTAADGQGGEFTGIVDSETFASVPHVILPEPSDFVVFGDSLSDQGNSYQAWGTPDSPPYWNGRFSDGAVWSERTGQELGVIMSAGRGAASGNNRAFGGAHSGDGYYAFVIPNAGRQVDDYTSNNDFAGDEIVALWIGGNDYLNSGETDTQKVVDAIESHLLQIIDDGATELLVPNLPPLDRTPKSVEDDSEEERAALRDRVIEHNQRLDAMLNETEAARSVTIHRLDSHTLFEVMWHRPSLFDLVNVTDPACEHDGLMCSDGDPIAPNKHQYVFFDEIHPTARTHELMTLFTLTAIGQPDGDADGIADADDVCPGTVLGTAVLEDGCDAPPPDADADGVPDEEDRCPGTPAGAAADEDGCSADQRDGDLDGVSDADDLCPSTPVGEVADETGCSATERDGDGDGIVDAYDSCPDTPAGEVVAGDGCADIEVDRDGDGVMEDRDACPGTPRGENVNALGCGPSQSDADGDGVADLYDACPDTPAGDPVDETGCGTTQRDGDDDGIVDAEDLCPGTVFIATSDSEGCSDHQRDGDSDSRLDWNDDCPTTPGSLRGCPTLTLSGSLATPPTSPEDVAVVSLVIDCEANCSVEMTNAPWSEEVLRLDSGEHLVEVVGKGAGSFDVSFRIEVEGTFATSTVQVTWPDSTPVPEPTDQEGSTEDPVAVRESVQSDDESGILSSNLLLLAVLGAANGLAFMMILQKRRARNRKRRASQDPQRLMDQTSLFR